jgi:hypothetical protein
MQIHVLLRDQYQDVQVYGMLSVPNQELLP